MPVFIWQITSTFTAPGICKFKDQWVHLCPVTSLSPNDLKIATKTCRLGGVTHHNRYNSLYVFIGCQHNALMVIELLSFRNTYTIIFRSTLSVPRLPLQFRLSTEVVVGISKTLRTCYRSADKIHTIVSRNYVYKYTLSLFFPTTIIRKQILRQTHSK